MEHKEEGNLLFKAQKWSEAIDEYSKGIADESVAPDTRGLLLSNRCQCRLNISEWQLALDDADACLSLIPAHIKTYFRRGTAYEKLGKETEALSDFVKVAKAEPKNAAAVEAAKRLKNFVMKSTDKKRDEVLPVQLLQTLRDGGDAPSTEEQKVDACKKLRALTVHRQMTGTLMAAGTVELMINISKAEETPSELRAQALGVLMSMASGHEVTEADRDEDLKDVKFSDDPKNKKDVNKPMDVTASATEVRKRLRALLPLAEMRRLCRPYAVCMRHLAHTVGFTHEMEDIEALNTLHDALSFFAEAQEVDVPRAGVVGLSQICERRRRMGKMGQIVMPTVILMKCLESALNTTTCDEPLKVLMASVFALLGDEDDRPNDKKVDLSEVAHKILEPFLGSQDINMKINGLAGLSALFAASAKSANKMLHVSATPLTALLTSLSKPPPGPEGRTCQDHAAECLLLTTGDLKTRQHLIDGGGIDMLLGSLQDGQETSKGLVRAKLVGVLAMLAAHNAEVREEVFERTDFLLEMRDAMETAKESSKTAQADRKSKKEGAEKSIHNARKLARSLYESCACLTIHGEFKETLFGAKKTLKAAMDLSSGEDLSEDANLAFLYTSLAYNLCISREDKVRPKKREFPFNELGDDDINALEEFYEKMPAESRPVKNGEVDGGTPEHAQKVRAWLASPSSGAPIIANLSKCVLNGSERVKTLVALIMKFLCAEQSHRRFIVACGGIRAILGLIDIEEEKARDAARQSLAQICIVVNPTNFTYSEQLDAVRPLVEHMEHKHELMQFEAAMGLTNLLTVGEELRTRALQADAWRVCRDLLFSENEMVQRAGIETMCNFTMAPEIVERFATEKAELEIKIFAAFSLSEDRPTQVASCGALAMLAQYEEIAVRISVGENYENLLTCLIESSDADIEHRVTSCLASIIETEATPFNRKEMAKFTLREKQKAGFASSQAGEIAKAALNGATLQLDV